MSPDLKSPFEKRLLEQLEEYREHLREPRTASSQAGSIVPTRWLAVAGAALAAVTIAGVVTVIAERSGSTTAAPRTVAQIKQRMLLVVSSTDDRILYETETEHDWGSTNGGPLTLRDGGRRETWQDLTTNRTRSVQYDSLGRIEVENVSSTSDGALHTDFVIYLERTWMTQDMKVGGASSNGEGPQGMADLFRRLFQDGVFMLAGSSTINGHPVLELKRTLPNLVPSDPGRTLGPATVRLWVDADTYLPVRQEINQHGAVTSVTDYSWLPRTPENLSKLDLVVPSGFKHVQSNTSSGSSSSSTWSITLHPKH